MKRFLEICNRGLYLRTGFSFVFHLYLTVLYIPVQGAIAGGWYHHNIESSLDLRLPFVPQFLMSISDVIYSGQ